MINIRAFTKNDREVVRQICCDVADRGEKIENIFHDRQFAGDILTNYYTDYEPESSFVAESEGKVVAYINGCLDNRRYGLVILFIIVPKMIVKGFLRGVFFRGEFYHMIKAMLKNWRRIFVWRKKSFHSHEGHVHIGVAKDFRRHQIGEQLVNAFCHYAKEHKVREITASVHDANTSACQFFEHLGFLPKERYAMVMVCGNSFKEYHSICYVKSLV